MQPKILFLFALFYCSTVPTTTQKSADFLQDRFPYTQQSALATNPKLHNFKFESRNVGGKKIAVVSFKPDPERDRRSILVPDAEGLLQPQPYAPLRHNHQFLPLFEDESMYTLNSSINWDSYLNKVPPPRVTNEERALNEIDRTLQSLEKILEKRENAIESSSLNLNDQDDIEKRKNKNMKRKRNKMREKKKEKRKQIKKEKKKSRKPRVKMFGPEACQYKILKKCAKSLRLLPKNDVQNMTEYEKCDQRKDFLECVEKRRLNNKPCKDRSVARGNMPSLRTWIKKLFWTSSSCLLNEAMKRR